MNAIMLRNRIFYTFKPLIPRRLQISIRRKNAAYKREKYASTWPIDPSAGEPPEGWQGWPDGKQFALVLSHDVDTKNGHDKVLKLAELEEKLGFRSSFNFVPERYKSSVSVHEKLRSRGFEIGLHGLKHDGKLFTSPKIFDKRATEINRYLKLWNISGFTAPSMHHNLAWMHSLKITHSTSTFDTDPFEPQPDGVGTIFPFLVSDAGKQNGFFELPYTLPQDFTLFVLLQQKDIDIWKKKLDWIAEKGGMVLLNTHSDYMNFEGGPCKNDQYPASYYIDFLQYIKSEYLDEYWSPLPSEMAKFWRTRN